MQYRNAQALAGALPLPPAVAEPAPISLGGPRRLVVLACVMMALLAASVVLATVFAVGIIDDASIRDEQDRASTALEVVLPDGSAADATTAARLAHDFSLPQARFVVPSQVAPHEISVAVPGRPELLLAWKPRRLGSQLFTTLAPIRISASVLFMGGIALILWRLYHLSVELEQRRRAAQDLATRDSLTGLANRFAFEQRLEEGLADESGDLALLFVDLDDFKQVNDGMGHGAGDLLLRMVAARLTEIARPGDLVARVGGDEIGIVVRQGTTRADLAERADDLKLALAAPFEIGGNDVTIGASIGIATSCNHGRDAEALLRAADAALYRAKAAGGRCYLFAEDSLSPTSRAVAR
jgi:diguanylate cyclase (GGDEF)-like protein